MPKSLLPIVVVMFSLVLGASVFRTEVASAAQLLQVFVANTPAQPVPVQQQGVIKTDRGQAWQSQTVTTGIQSAGFIDLYTVPAGKQLEIEYVYVTYTYPNTDDPPYVSLYTSVGVTTAGWSLQMPSPTGAAGGFLAKEGSHLVRIYADAGTQVRLWVNPDTSTGGGIQLSGRLFDVP